MDAISSRHPTTSSRAVRCAGGVALALLALAVSPPAWAARLVEVRVGEYDTFTRVVFELDTPSGYGVEHTTSAEGGSEILVTLAGASPTKRIPTRSERVDGIALQHVSGEQSQARVRLSDPTLRLERMVLETPPRLVLDVLSADSPSSAAARTGAGPAWIEKTAVLANAPAETGPVVTEVSPEPPPTGASRGSEPPAPIVVADVPGEPSEPPAPIVVADVPGEPSQPVRPGGPAPAAPRAASGGEPFFPVTRFEPAYAEPHPALPPVESLGQLAIELGQVADGYVAPRDGVPSVTVRLSDSFAPPANRFYAGAILSINQALVSELNSQGYVGVLVAPDEKDIFPSTGADLRPSTRTALGLLVYVGRVKDIRTFASGQRVHPDQRLDNPVHQPIIDRSPVKPEGAQDLIRKDELDGYTARLNRHPGRRVDVLISPAREPGGAYLDYMVSELKPWFVYGGASNTGTESTTEWRERFGFTHTQLTNHDDILSIDYVTGNFSTALNAVSLLYDFPLWFTGNEWVWGHMRFRPFGNYLNYSSDVLGFPGKFKGWGTWGGGDLIVNVFQHRNFFLDLYGGLRYAHHDVDNQTILEKRSDDFFLPRWGLRTQHLAETNAFFANVNFETNVPSAADTDLRNLQWFGRPLVVDDWFVMRWDSAGYFYLEPLLFRKGWKDPSTPGTSTLAHEIYLAFRGQYAFDNRLIPQEMSTVGGLFTVRGYREAVATGDTTLVGNVEYRLHIPRLFRPVKDPVEVPVVGGFRWAPQQVYGQPDWDLIFRAFFDVGRAIRSELLVTETNETLLGAGVGLELQVKRNLAVRFDYGWRLETLTPRPGLPGEEAGDGRAHFLVRCLY